MKSRLFLSTLLLCGFCVSHAFARIGDTEAQIEKRYGPSVITFSKGKELLRRGYLSGGLRITVTYLDGVSQMEIYLKPDKSKFSQPEIDTLLAANAGGGTWTELPRVSYLVQQWKCDASERAAAYTEAPFSVSVVTNRCFELQKAEKEKTEKEKLKNF